MTLTTNQLNVYNIMLGMNGNGPLTDEKRTNLLSVDLSPFGISQEDKQVAVRWYESVIGLTLQSA